MRKLSTYKSSQVKPGYESTHFHSTAQVLNSAAVVFNGGEFASHKTFSNIWRHFWLLKLECEVDWHLLGRGQWRSCTPYNTQDSPPPPTPSTELSGPKCLQFRGWETFYTKCFYTKSIPVDCPRILWASPLEGFSNAQQGVMASTIEPGTQQIPDAYAMDGWMQGG